MSDHPAEIDALRLANEALQGQLIRGAEQTEQMLQQLEAQRNELREMHREQQATNQFVRRVIDTVGSLVLILDREGFIVRTNKASRAALPGLEGLDRPVVDAWIHPEDLAQLHHCQCLRKLPWPVHSVLFETIRCQHGYFGELRLRSPDLDAQGQPGCRYYQLNARMLYDDYGKEEGAVVNATDITSLKQLTDHLEQRVTERTAELSDALERLTEHEKLATLGGLVAGMAHEVNTPISNTRLVANTVIKDVATVKQALQNNELGRRQLTEFFVRCNDACVILETSTRRASELIASFKQVAVDETSMRRRQFDLATLLRETLQAIMPAFKRQPVKVDIDVEANVVLDTYPGALEQVVINLVSNAVKHGPAEGRTLHVTVRGQYSADQPGWCHVSVTDDGQGMSPEVAARAFDRFFSTKVGQGGSGLGLYLVNNLVGKVLGGRIDMQTASDQGTRFDVLIPAVLPEPEVPAGG